MSWYLSHSRLFEETQGGECWFHPRTFSRHCSQLPPDEATQWATWNMGNSQGLSQTKSPLAVRGLDSGRSGVITRRQNLNQLWSNMSELESIMINYDHIVSVLHCVACVLFGCPLLGVHMLKLWFSHKIIWGSPVGLLKICLSTLSVSIWIQSCFGDPVCVQGSRAQSVAWERDRGTKAKCQARGADQWPITLMAQVATGVMLVNKPPI
jgi:hypothetical protein